MYMLIMFVMLIFEKIVKVTSFFSYSLFFQKICFLMACHSLLSSCLLHCPRLYSYIVLILLVFFILTCLDWTDNIKPMRKGQFLDL